MDIVIGLGIFAAVIGGLVVLGLVGLHLYVYLSIWKRNAILAKTLKAKDRTLSLSEAKQRIANKQGIIVADNPTIGWNVNRIWWSPVTKGSDASDTPLEERMTSPRTEADYKTFIDPETGCAFLVRPFIFSGQTREFLRSHFGMSDCLYVHTGACLWERDSRERAEKSKLREQ